ncbi:helix-turn-helix domain-containing protein [Streptomyces sp. ISL-98]|uniref:telomere-protecting terminal protein Tpg n=1 Tax=Streptomyces sp. ISL-98 TaxID=2819192 RepID=UPI001BE83F7C|nr:helix-turn-helix domain-containing protein [Streptomyces sp. ISL-98]MBT2508538.1 helix-turn-helix domain-containing protein [Streptomyces sp. ISL-98]
MALRFRTPERQDAAALRLFEALEKTAGQARAGLLARARATLPARLHTPHAQIAYLHRRTGGSTRKVADMLGVHPETVRRYLKGLRKHPPADFASRLESAVRGLYRPRTRISQAQVDAAMCARGLRVNIRASFGFSGPGGTSDDPRERWLNEDLTREATRDLVAAWHAGATTRALELVSHGVTSAYFDLEPGMESDISTLAYVDFEL